MVYLIFFSWILSCIFILMYILFEPSVLHPLPKLFSYVVAPVFSVYFPVPVPLCQMYLCVCVSLLRCCSYFLFYFFYNSCLLYHVSASTFSPGWLSQSVHLCLGLWLFPRPLIVLRVCVYLLSCNLLVVPVLLSCKSLLILYGWNFSFTIVVIVCFGFTLPLLKLVYRQESTVAKLFF